MKEGKNFISDEIISMIEEREVGFEMQETLNLHMPNEKILSLSDVEKYRIIGELIEITNCIPDHKKVVDIFTKIINEILSKKLYYYQIRGTEELSLKKQFRREFVKFFKDKAEDLILEPFENKFSKSLTELYKDRQILLETDGYKNFAEFDDSINESKISEKNVYFKGFEYSIYKYNRFDSKQEQEFAKKLDKIMKKENKKENFWIKNASKGEYEIEKSGQNNYNPDFIIYFNKQLYLVEIKGEGYLTDFEKSGNKEILKKLGEDFKKLKTLLIMAKDIDNKLESVETFEDILKGLNDLET